MVGVHGEGHELFQRHAILGIDVEEGRGHGGEFQALLHDLGRDEEGCSDRFLALTLLTQGLKGAELVERVQSDALHVLRQRVILGEDILGSIAHDAGDRCGLRQPLLLHQQRQRLEATATGWDLEHAGLDISGIDHRPDGQALQEPATRDVFGQFLDRNASLDAPHVGLAQHELVEGNVPRRGQCDFLGNFRHQIFSTTGAGSHSPDLTSRHLSNPQPFPLPAPCSSDGGDSSQL